MRLQIVDLRLGWLLSLQSKIWESEMARRLCLVGGLVVARLSARLTIHQAIVANANVDHRLTQAAELFALARSLWHLTLGAFITGRTGSGAHAPNLSRFPSEGKMTSVMESQSAINSQQSTVALTHVSYNSS